MWTLPSLSTTLSPIRLIDHSHLFISPIPPYLLLSSTLYNLLDPFQIHHNAENGLKIVDSSVFLEDCVIAKNSKKAFHVCGVSSRLYLAHCDVRGNMEGTFCDESMVRDPHEKVSSSVPFSSLSSSSSPSRGSSAKNESISSAYNDGARASFDTSSGEGQVQASSLLDHHKHIEPESQITQSYDGSSQNRDVSGHQETVPSSSALLPLFTERRLFVKHCIGDEEAVMSFCPHRWVDAEEDTSELTLSLNPEKASKSSDGRALEGEGDTAESLVSKLKRKREHSGHFSAGDLSGTYAALVSRTDGCMGGFEEMDANIDMDMDMDMGLDLGKADPGYFEGERDGDGAFPKMVKVEANHEYYLDVKNVKLEKF
jgi:hypothetical protein